MKKEAYERTELDMIRFTTEDVLLTTSELDEYETDPIKQP